jgi:hypothetical protein
MANMELAEIVFYLLPVMFACEDFTPLPHRSGVLNICPRGVPTTRQPTEQPRICLLGLCPRPARGGPADGVSLPSRAGENDMSTGTETLKRVVELSFEADENGQFPESGGGRVPVNVGDEIRIAFRGRAGSTPANLRVSIQGDSVESKGVADVRQMAGGHFSMGEGEIDAFLTTKKAGQSTVGVTFVDPDGKAAQTYDFIVIVS